MVVKERTRPTGPPVYPPSSLFDAFRNCWPFAALLGLLGGGFVGIAWWFALPEQYSAEIGVRIPAPWAASAGNSVNDEEIARCQRTQTALIQSTAVLEAALRRPEAARLVVVQSQLDPLSWLGNQLTVRASPIADVLHVCVRAPRADEAVVLAQAIADVYRSKSAAASETPRKNAAVQDRVEIKPVLVANGETKERAIVRRVAAVERLLGVSLGGGGCGALLMLAVCWREARWRRIRSGSALAGTLGLPVVGNIPGKHLQPARAREQLEKTGTTQEAVDALRTVLMHERDKGPRAILVASAVGGEGKTSLSILLAASLARAWHKTLLLDADLRKPGAHALFQKLLEPGLSEVLRGEAETSEVIQPTEVSRLWMIAAGHTNAHALQALAQDGASRFFDALKEQFDCLVIDAGPILPVADALLLCPHVDAVLLAVRSGFSRLPLVHAAQQRLAALDAPLRGAVLLGPDGDLDESALIYPAAR